MIRDSLSKITQESIKIQKLVGIKEKEKQMHRLAAMKIDNK